MTEQEPRPFEPKSDYAVTLEEYNGIASDLMEVNEVVADGFMSVADMRKDIVIVSKQPQRTMDYDQLRHVKVGRQLKIPTFGRRQDSTVDVSSDEDAWYVGVDDQAIARRVDDNRGKQRFDELFTADFTKEVNKGIKKALIREKVSNGENLDSNFIYSYLMTFIGIKYSIEDILSKDPAGLVITYLIFQTGANVWNKQFSSGEHNSSESFVRSSYKECLLPAVPFDRMARGVIYIANHGSKIIEGPSEK